MHPQAAMREKSEELRGAVEEWQARADCGEGASAPPRPRLLACFLDGAHPIVDVYELKVRGCRVCRVRKRLDGLLVVFVVHILQFHIHMTRRWFCVY